MIWAICVLLVALGLGGLTGAGGLAIAVFSCFWLKLCSASAAAAVGVFHYPDPRFGFSKSFNNPNPHKRPKHDFMLFKNLKKVKLNQQYSNQVFDSQSAQYFKHVFRLEREGRWRGQVLPSTAFASTPTAAKVAVIG